MLAGTGMAWRGAAGWLLVDLTMLAMLAITAHGCHISPHTLPDKTTKLILLDSLLQEINSWGAQLKQRQNDNTA
jgi:hypothetical protein